MPNSLKNIQILYPKYFLNDTYVFKIIIELLYFKLSIPLNIFSGYVTAIIGRRNRKEHEEEKNDNAKFWLDHFVFVSHYEKKI